MAVRSPWPGYASVNDGATSTGLCKLSVAQTSALNASLRLDCFRFIAFGIASVKFRSDYEPWVRKWGFSEWAASAWPCVICVTEERFDPAHIREVGWGRV